VLHDLENNRTVKKAVKAKNPITQIAHRSPAKEILIAAMRRERHPRDNPFAQLLFGVAIPSITPES